jgi:hypothetical protein
MKVLLVSVALITVAAAGGFTVGAVLAPGKQPSLPPQATPNAPAETEPAPGRTGPTGPTRTAPGSRPGQAHRSLADRRSEAGAKPGRHRPADRGAEPHAFITDSHPGKPQRERPGNAPPAGKNPNGGKAQHGQGNDPHKAKRPKKKN